MVRYFNFFVLSIDIDSNMSPFVIYSLFVVPRKVDDFRRKHSLLMF